MEPTTAIIQARSERQAMDWSLVLVSQGIETTIERAPENQGWQLLVSPLDHQRALLAIRQYRSENRGQIWLQRLPWTGLIFDWRSTAWFLLLVILFALDEARLGYLQTAGLMVNEAVWHGQWWRLFTAIMLHIDLAHLAGNVTIGILLLGLAMGAFGSGLALLAAYLAGVSGNVAGLILYSQAHRGLGASGMVMGALGLLTVQSFSLWGAGVSAKQLALRGVFGGTLLLVLWGLGAAPHTDVIAHVAGFLAGSAFGGLLLLLPRSFLQNVWVNRCAELICASLIVVTWGLALASPGQ